MMEYKSILVTGGTGSFGKAFIRRILEHYPSVERLVILSRDELKQGQDESKFNEKNFQFRYFLGDVRDKDRLRFALEGVEAVIHAAALKQVPGRV